MGNLGDVKMKRTSQGEPSYLATLYSSQTLTSPSAKRFPVLEKCVGHCCLLERVLGCQFQTMNVFVRAEEAVAMF